jgi:hypothetical protein
MNTKGGTSPIKLRAGKAKSRRGGAEAGKATAKKGNYLGGRGGYKKSSGAQGTGVNRGGYNVHTRFKPRAKPEAPKGGGSGTTDNTPSKPYSFDKDGNIVINNYNVQNNKGGTGTNTGTSNEGWEYKQDPNETTSERKSKGSFKDVWDKNENNFQDKWKTQGGFEAWKKQAQKEIDEGYYEKKTTKDGKKWKRKWTSKDGGEKEYSDWEEY